MSAVQRLYSLACEAARVTAATGVRAARVTASRLDRATEVLIKRVDQLGDGGGRRSGGQAVETALIQEERRVVEERAFLSH
ncbi:unnamed protein product [Merluccius merluccius]